MEPSDIAIISAACLVATIVIVTITASFVAFKMLIGRRKVPPQTAAATSSKILPNPLMGENYIAMETYYRLQRAELGTKASQEVRVSTDDGLKLYAKYYKSLEASDTTIICLHGYTSTGEGDFAAIANFYLSHKYNVLLVDNRAHGKSEGKYVGFGVLDRYDALKWINYIDENHPNQKIILHGISMGAAAALMAGGLELPASAKGIIADCGFTSPWDIFALQIRQNYRIHPFPILHIMEVFSKIFARYGFSTVTVTDACRKTRIPTLFIHGTEDVFVPYYMSKTNFDTCGAPRKKLVLIDGAGHAGSFFKNPQKYGNEVLDFIDKAN